MNMGIITSFVVGGLMLLSILAYNMQLSSSTQETTISAINQQRLNDIVEVISFDLKRVGYNNTTSFMDDPIITAEPDEIEFKTSEGNITWYTVEDDKVTTTTNPNDFYLYRDDGNGTITKYPVTHFKLMYYDKDNNVVNDISTLFQQRDVSIEVEVMVESGEPMNSRFVSGGDVNNTYHRTVWKRTFSPNNINKPWY